MTWMMRRSWLEACGLDVPGRTAPANVQNLGCQLEEGIVAMEKTEAEREMSVGGGRGVCSFRAEVSLKRHQ